MHDYIARLGIEPDGKKMYPVLPFLEEQQRRIAADTRKGNFSDEEPPVRSWSDVEKREKVEKLRIEIQTLKGEIMQIDEVKAVLAEHSSAVRSALDNFVQHVAAKTRDGELLRFAEAARDSALMAITEGLK